MGGYNPEKIMLAASETRLSEPQEALYPLLVDRKPRIDMNSFRDLYDVDKDLAIVREIEEKIKERNRKEGVPESSLKAGEHFELVVDFAIDEAGILGPNATSKRASRFDDIVGGIDGYVEFEEEGMTSHLALAMDVTRNTDDISKKFLRNRTSIDNGELFTGKYYKSDAAHFRGELGHVVRELFYCRGNFRLPRPWRFMERPEAGSADEHPFAVHDRVLQIGVLAGPVDGVVVAAQKLASALHS